MITKAPCGCSTVSVASFDNIKDIFLQGKVIWFEDMRKPNFDDLRLASNGSKGFMVYDKSVGNIKAPVYSRLQTPEDDDMIRVAEFPLGWATDQLEIFYNLGFEFSYSKAKVDREGKEITMRCSEKCVS